MLKIMSTPRPWSQTVLPTQAITRINVTSQSYTNTLLPGTPLDDGTSKETSRIRTLESVAKSINDNESLDEEREENNDAQQPTTASQSHTPDVAVIIPREYDSQSTDSTDADSLLSEIIPEPETSREVPENISENMPENMPENVPEIPEIPTEFSVNIPENPTENILENTPENIPEIPVEIPKIPTEIQEIPTEITEVPTELPAEIPKLPESFPTTATIEPFVEKGEKSVKAVTPILNTITASEFVETIQQTTKSSNGQAEILRNETPLSESSEASQGSNETTPVSLPEDEPILRRPSKRAKKKKRYFLRGWLLLLLCIGMFLGQDQLIQSTIDLATAELKEGSFLTQTWANIPIPINLCFYLFGMKNAAQFLRGAKPHLEEHGPFCYFLGRKRRVLEWKANSLTFMERIDFEFNPEASQSLDTKFETINLPIFVSVLVARQILAKFYVGFMGSMVYNSIALSLRFSGESWIEEITPRQLLVARRVPILAFLHRMLLPLRSIGVPVPDAFGADGFTLANHSFGFTTTISSGELGPYEVYSRTEDGHLLGDIISFKEAAQFPGLDEPCNSMTGGDGMFWRRPVIDEHLTLFLQPTCGLLPFVKEYDHLFHGAQVIRYKFDDQFFNASNGNNRCFCKKATLAECQGWHDISPCTGGIAPMGFTLPHFHLSPNLLEQVDGLRPDVETHGGFLDMEPLMGAPVNARIGIQGVVAMGPVEQVPLMAKLPKCIFPIMWIKVQAGADGILGLLLGFGSNFVRYGSWLWLLGIPFALLLFYFGYRQRRQTAVFTEY